MAASGAGVDITVGEGQPFTKRVAVIDTCFFSGATITWGDGTPPSAGSLDAPDGVKGSHTYAEEGTYVGSVSYTTDCTPSGHVTFTATVQDAPLSAAGRDVSGTSGQSVSGVVAHFADTSTTGTLSDFSAQIAWGDGAKTAGTVTAAAGGGYDVSGAHTYSSSGSFAVTLTIADVGGSTATTSLVATIADAAPPAPAVGTAPVADFSYTPSAPCRGESVTFDASGSSDPRYPITQYQWSFANVIKSQSPEVVQTTSPSLTRAFALWGMSNEPPGLPEFTGLPDIFSRPFQMQFLRPPVAATLTVVDSAGLTASTTRTVTFANPLEHVELTVNDDDTWTRTSPNTPCDDRVAAREALAARIAAAALASPYATLNAQSDLISLVLNCQDPAANCYGALDLAFRQPTRHRARIAATKRRRKHAGTPLGRSTYAVTAGQRATVTIRLNAATKKLLRTQKRRTLMLRLAALGADGTAAITTRTLRLRHGR
jgi:hypothetical protein